MLTRCVPDTKFADVVEAILEPTFTNYISFHIADKITYAQKRDVA